MESLLTLTGLRNRYLDQSFYRHHCCSSQQSTCTFLRCDRIVHGWNRYTNRRHPNLDLFQQDMFGENNQSPRSYRRSCIRRSYPHPMSLPRLPCFHMRQATASHFHPRDAAPALSCSNMCRDRCKRLHHHNPYTRTQHHRIHNCKRTLQQCGGIHPYWSIPLRYREQRCLHWGTQTMLDPSCKF